MRTSRGPKAGALPGWSLPGFGWLRSLPGHITEEKSAGVPFERGVSWGSQTYAKPDEGLAVGQPYIKLSAFEQTTGEAIYTHDIPVPVRGVQGAFVTSTVVKADFHY